MPLSPIVANFFERLQKAPTTPLSYMIGKAQPGTEPVDSRIQLISDGRQVLMLLWRAPDMSVEPERQRAQLLN